VAEVTAFAQVNHPRDNWRTSALPAPNDLAPDGRRIAALMPAEAPEAQQAQNHVIFLMNFADELQRKVPAGK
jgi:hypothetical protein